MVKPLCCVTVDLCRADTEQTDPTAAAVMNMTVSTGTEARRPEQRRQAHKWR